MSRTPTACRGTRLSPKLEALPPTTGRRIRNLRQTSIAAHTTALTHRVTLRCCTPFLRAIALSWTRHRACSIAAAAIWIARTRNEVQHGQTQSTLEWNSPYEDLPVLVQPRCGGGYPHHRLLVGRVGDRRHRPSQRQGDGRRRGGPSPDVHLRGRRAERSGPPAEAQSAARDR